MANAPLVQYKAGMVELARWAGEYKGTPTISYSLKKKKFDPDTKTYEESPFLTVTDLSNVRIVCEMMLADHYFKPKPAAQADPANSYAPATPVDDCPF